MSLKKRVQIYLIGGNPGKAIEILLEASHSSGDANFEQRMGILMEQFRQNEKDFQNQIIDLYNYRMTIARSTSAIQTVLDDFNIQ